MFSEPGEKAAVAAPATLCQHTPALHVPRWPHGSPWGSPFPLRLPRGWGLQLSLAIGVGTESASQREELSGLHLHPQVPGPYPAGLTLTGCLSSQLCSQSHEHPDSSFSVASCWLSRLPSDRNQITAGPQVATSQSHHFQPHALPGGRGQRAG